MIETQNLLSDGLVSLIERRMHWVELVSQIRVEFRKKQFKVLVL